MTSIRNLPLAARLGGAFGALCLALVVVAFTGVNAMHGLQSETDKLAGRHLRAAQLLGGMQQRAKDNMSLVGQHLYVLDGDLEAQDALAEDIEANWAGSKNDGAELEKLVRRHAGRRALRLTYGAARRRCWSLRSRRRAAREETARNAEDRDGSRAIFHRGPRRRRPELEAARRLAAERAPAFAADGVARRAPARPPAPASSSSSR